MKTIAFIGLGNMGSPMAENLIATGYPLRVFDLQASALAPFQNVSFAGNNVTVASSLTEVVAGAEVVITMLPAGKHVQSVYLGDDKNTGLLASITEGALVIDSSTIDVNTVKCVADKAAKYHIDVVDAPVSGGIAGAQAGTLTFMCGGDESAFKQAEPILQSMGKNVFHAGAVGAGQTAKMCNNLLLAIHMVGTAEALQLGIKNDLDPKVLSEIMLKSSGANWSLEKYNPAPGVMQNVPAANEFAPGFTVELMLKDLGLATENALLVGASTPLGALARNLYACHAQQHAMTQKPERQRNAKLDFSSIWLMLNQDI